jgi:hypothetical protein
MFKGKAMGSIIMLFLILFGAFYLISYLSSKGNAGEELMSHGMNKAYSNGPSGSVQDTNAVGVQPAQPMGQNEVYSGANGVQTSIPTPSSSCSTANIQNPEELLPKSGGNDQFAQLNPSGQGELSSVNLLKAGYHIGIDTIGQSLRNSNQQIRSEPANPQLYVGPWNNSTIEPDFMRPPLEIGAGGSQ